MIPVHHHRIEYFPVMGFKREVHVSKERGDIKMGQMKKERGAHNLSALCVVVIVEKRPENA